MRNTDKSAIHRRTGFSCSFLPFLILSGNAEISHSQINQARAAEQSERGWLEARPPERNRTAGVWDRGHAHFHFAGTHLKTGVQTLFFIFKYTVLQKNNVYCSVHVPPGHQPGFLLYVAVWSLAWVVCVVALHCCH